MLKQETGGNIGIGGKMGAIMACGALRTLNKMWREGIQKSKKQARGKAELTHSTATGQETDVFSLLLGICFLKKKKSWVPAFQISFFTQLLEGTCSGSFTSLGKGLARELCSLPPLSSSHRALSQTNLESAVRAGTGDFGEDHRRLPLGRAARPSSNPKAKPA